MKAKITLLTFTAALIAIASSLNSCNESGNGGKVQSTGKPGEILVVATKPLWKSTAGDSVRTFFAGPAIGLPQPEPLYKVVQVEEDEFNRLLKSHRNIMIMAIDSSLKEPVIEIRRDIWAAPQRVIKISAASIEGLKSIFGQKKDEILNVYDNAEIDRLQKLYSKTININGSEAVKKKFGFSMDIPADYFLAINKDNFIWFRREANRLSQGIIIYAYPYTDTIAYKPAKIVSVRNQFTQLYVPGPSDGSFMVVSDEVIKPEARTITLKGQLATEIRGLWEVRKDFMGGPFLSYTLVDKQSNMVITLDGYVYAPNQNKTELLKEVQSVLLTFKLAQK